MENSTESSPDQTSTIIPENIGEIGKSGTLRDRRKRSFSSNDTPLVRRKSVGSDSKKIN